MSAVPIRYAIGNSQNVAVAGRCDNGSLDSSISRLVNRLGYGEHNPATLAAIYACNVARNHPLIDCNNGRNGYWRLLRFNWRRMQKPISSGGVWSRRPPLSSFGVTTIDTSVVISDTGVGAAVEYKVDANEAITGMNTCLRNGTGAR